MRPDAMTVVILPPPLSPREKLLPAMFGLTLGPTLGVMLGIREPMLRLGERMKLCAQTAVPARYANSEAPAINTSAARRVFIRQLARSWTMGPRI